MMRRIFLPIVIAAALAATAPVSAQRQSLADRVSALEQRAASNQGNVDLLNQVTQLKNEVQALRSQIEELQQQNEQSKQGNRSQYLDLDGRLNRLEGSGGTSIRAPAASTATTPAVVNTAPAVAPASSEPMLYGDASAVAKNADERSAYN
ncbi:MAG: YbgF trimerization domain-containing protein, partial [Luteimonas sp.]